MQGSFRVGPFRVTKTIGNVAATVAVLVFIIVCICAPCVVGANFA